MKKRISTTSLISVVLALVSALPVLAQRDLAPQFAEAADTNAKPRSLADSLPESWQGVPGLTSLIVPAAAFVDDGPLPESSHFSFASGDLSGDATANGCSMAPVTLPVGAGVSLLRAWVTDDDAVEDISVQLRKLDTVTGSAAQMGNVFSLGTPGEAPITDDTIQDPIISLHDSIYLTTCVDSPDLSIHSAIIFYALEPS